MNLNYPRTIWTMERSIEIFERMQNVSCSQRGRERGFALRWFAVVEDALYVGSRSFRVFDGVLFQYASTTGEKKIRGCIEIIALDSRNCIEIIQEII